MDTIDQETNNDNESTIDTENYEDYSEVKIVKHF